MSFSDLYEACFRDLPVVLATKEKVTDLRESVTTLDNVFSSCQYLVFFFGAGQRSLELGRALEEMVKRRNEMKEEGTGAAGGKSKDSPARIRRFFGLKKKKSSSRDRASPDGGSTVAVVKVGDEEVVDGWFSLVPSEDARIRSRLLRSLAVETNPSIVVVESGSKAVITADGRRLLAEDALGRDFPWPTPDVSTVLSEGSLVRWEGDGVKRVPTGGERPQVRALLFGAVWCPPCREWLKQLVPIYASLRAASLSFEIIFCSSDRSEEAFAGFIQQMPWVSLAYDPAKTIALTRIFNVNGIPSLIFIDPDCSIITRHGRNVLLEDPKGGFFPWGSRPLNELNEHSAARIRDEPSLILFTEGSPEDVRFSLSILDEVAPPLHAERLEREERRRRTRRGGGEREEKREESEGSSRRGSGEEGSTSSSMEVAVPGYADPLQVFYTGEDPICDHILERILLLGDADLPLLVIVDSAAGVYAVCEEQDVSREIIAAFVAGYKAGKLAWRPLASAESTRTVGGIPTAMIREAARQSALIKMSPSQGSIGEESKQGEEITA